MGPFEAVAILGAGVAAGAVNAVVGSGSLITFPTLLAFGFPPVLANVSNNIGQVPGNVSGATGYRRELVGQRTRLVRLGALAAAGSACGAAALLLLPSSSFLVIVPGLIFIGCALVLAQPWLSRKIMDRRARRVVSGSGRVAAGLAERPPDPAPADQEPVSLALGAGVLASAVYGGYFGAAQGVLLTGLLGTFTGETMQRANGAKNVLVAVVNGVAAVVYLIFAHVVWLVVLLIGVGSTLGGVVGARFGRRLPPLALRIFVVAIGVVSAVKLLFF